MIAALLAVAAAVWAVSIRTRPTFAVYDSVPANLPPRPDTASAVPATPVPVRRTSPSRTVRAPAVAARANATADTAAAPDSVRHHRSDNYGGYGGYGSKERRGNPNAR